MKTIFLIPLLLVTVMSTARAVTGKVEWTANPFVQQLFIENNGQFDEESRSGSSKILFGTSSDGVDLYFCKEGLTYHHDERILMSKEEMEAAKNVTSTGYTTEDEEEEKEGRTMKSLPHYLSIKWVGANPSLEIIAADPVTFYYTYAAPAGTITAHVYKKIIYKNLYPNIDIEYVLPEGKGGIKYTVIVHPGGDVSQIKMRYGGANHLERDDNGNVTIESSFGEFIDHAPATSVNGLTIPSSFLIHGNEIAFAVDSYDESQTLIIDPWITNPTFPGYNAAYDVNYDREGNVYAYGSFAPLKLAKFNHLGEVQWIFHAVDFGKNRDANMYRSYGDFAVDEASGISYLVEGYNSPGARVLKLNAFGFQTGLFAGSSSMNEMWRVEYNHCTNKLVIGGGGTNAWNQAAILDPDMIEFSPMNVCSASRAWVDMTLLAMDNESNFCFMGSAGNDGSGLGYNPQLIKCPIPNLLPPAFSVQLRHAFKEVGNLTYINGKDTNYARSANGMNGMAVSSNWLYTYDSDLLIRWDKYSGAFVTMKNILPSTPLYNTRGGIQVSWGGLAVDASDNLYVGLKKTIVEYDSLLTLRNTIVLPDTVYDVKLGNNNKLYACGIGFVTQYDLLKSDHTVTTTKLIDCDSCGGTATVYTYTNNPAGISYSWNTNPVQTGQTATGLCPGTYTVTVKRNCVVEYIDSITISAVSLRPVITSIGKQPGDVISIPILLTPSTKFTTAKEIKLSVKYDPALLRFVNVTSPVGIVSNVKSINGELLFTVTLSSQLPTPTATIAELHMEALLAPYVEGEIEVTQSLITLASGDEITGGNCSAIFTLDSSCVMPHELRKKPTAEITGLYPNPSRVSITMEVFAQNNANVRIEVYDAFGRQIKTVFEGLLNNGKNGIAIATEAYSNGIYFCRLVNGSKIITKAFNVQR